MKRALLFILAGIALIVALDRIYAFNFPAVSVYEKSQKAEKPQHKHQSTHSLTLALIADIEEFIEAHEKFFIVLATIAIAAFTYTLWASTDGLFAMAKKQAGDMKESLRIGAVAADAAKVGANAAVIASMPILAPYITYAEKLYPPSISTNPIAPYISYVMQNLGATPAIIRSVNTELRLVDREELPDIDFDKLSNVHHERIVQGKAIGEDAIAPGADIRTPAFRNITTQEHAALLEEAVEGGSYKRFFLVGKVVYDDFFNTRHTAIFCLKVRSHGYSGPHGGTRYNRITRQPIPEEGTT